MTISANASYESAVLNDDLTVAAPNTLTMTGSNPIYVGNGVGTNATLTIASGATLTRTSSTYYDIKAGYCGATGTVVIASGATAALRGILGFACNEDGLRTMPSRGELILNGSLSVSSLIFGSYLAQGLTVPYEVGEIHLSSGGVLSASSAKHNDYSHATMYFGGGELRCTKSCEFFSCNSSGAFTDLVFEDGQTGILNTQTNDVLLGSTSRAVTRLLGSGTLVKRGSGTLDLKNGLFDVTNFTGDVSVEAGTLRLEAPARFRTADGYRQYRFTVTEGWGENRGSVEFSELAFYKGDEDVTGQRSGIIWEGTFGSAPASSPYAETVTNLFDGKTSTKYLDRRGSVARQSEWNDVNVIVVFPEPMRITSYKWATGNSGGASYRCGGADCRDPKSWKLEGSNDGVSWTPLDVRTDVVSPATTQTYTDPFAVTWPELPTWTIAAGATLELSGTGCLRANVAGTGTLKLVDGASLAVSNVAAGTSLTIEANGGALSTIGSDELTVVGDAAFDAGVSVEKGTLRFVTDGTDDRYWRFSLKQTGNNVNFEMTELGLYACDGTRLDLGITLQAKDLAATALEAGRLTYSSAYTTSSGGTEIPQCLFDGNVGTKCYFNQMALKTDDSSTWRVITFRLPSTATQKVRGYNICTGTDGTGNTLAQRMPRAWRLESSADGETWTIRDERAYAADEVPTTTRTWFVTDGNLALQALEAAGSCPFATTTPVSVASGATLDVGTDAVIGRLVVDMTAGAGTISTFAPAENGTLALTNVAAPIQTACDVPVTFGTLTDAAALKTWSVSVNGVVQDNLVVRFLNNTLRVRPRAGLSIIVY